ncbi:Zonadhesin [Holothuria leucospilota]|uniref:Zonadhesin n=1 Tax=Holothuria leucospilota TaxID=206669 RepID=A0A9Q1BTH7_HOLLE|nr:Zonadhesin [Holothuria leucospilota]
MKCTSSISIVKSTCSCGRHVLTSDFGLVLAFDPTKHSLDVEVSVLYYEALCGMLGSCNNNASDDFMLPSGDMVIIVAKSGADFGNAWATNERLCEEDPGIAMVSSDMEGISEAEAACFLLDSEILYSDCHDLVHPYVYFHACVYDYFVLREESVIHRHISQYDKACNYAGIDIGAEYLAESCPPGMVYDPCGPACPETCSPRFTSIDCSEDCVKTCTCPDGMVLDGVYCVNPRNCGCDASNGVYLSVKADDFIEFGNSWVVAGECRPNQQSVLGIRSYGEVLAQDELRAKDKCFIIADRYDLFETCHDFIDPEEHYHYCVSDYIQNPQYFCESLALYCARCTAAGGPTLQWRSLFPECGTDNFKCKDSNA